MTIAILPHLLMIAQAAAQQGAQPAPATLTAQQRFDRASAAAEQGKCDDALRDFALIEANEKAMRNPTVSAAVAVRKGICLTRTAQLEAGEASIRRGLPVLKTLGDSFNADVRDAHMMLGMAAGNRLDYATAETEYRAALAVASGNDRIRPLLALAQVLSFDGKGDGTGEAVRLAGEARQMALADKTLGKENIAVVQTRYARALLNDGKPAEAYAELKDGLRRQGGLDLKVNLADMATRSDLALVAILNKDEANARKYLAYTGTGRLKNADFRRGATMDPPICGAATGLKPTDFAVVEFTIEEDGRVSGTTPIYATGGRKAALAFAAAVAEWSWEPEAAKAIPLLYRYTTRVELRCSNAAEPPSLSAPLRESYAAWIGTLVPGEPEWEGRTDAVAGPLQRAALSAAAAKSDKAAQLRATVALIENPTVSPEERVKLMPGALALAQALNAPVSAQIHFALRGYEDQERSRPPRPRNITEYRGWLRGMLARPEVAADPLSAATLRLSIAKAGYRKAASEDAAQLVAAVIDSPLPERHPLKVNALLQQANLRAEAQDFTGAAQAFARTGLTEEQCALVGVSPAIRRNNAGSGDFPQEALRWGFEGWTRTEYDVGADGVPLTPRVLIAYPPFVFGAAGQKVASNFRYEKSFRPSGGKACSANSVNINFSLPN